MLPLTVAVYSAEYYNVLNVTLPIQLTPPTPPTSALSVQPIMYSTQPQTHAPSIAPSATAPSVSNQTYAPTVLKATPFTTTPVFKTVE